MTRRELFRPVAVARHVINLGPFADHNGLIARWLPVIVRQRLDALIDPLRRKVHAVQSCYSVAVAQISC